MGNEPVLCSDGFYYDRDFILEWLTQHSRSPMTNLVLENPSIRMDVEFAKEIETWIANRWQIFQENQGMDPMQDQEDGDNDEEKEDTEDGRSDNDDEGDRDSRDDMEEDAIDMMGNN